jgi:phenylpropionate dioxygenase-like ring-hydroxylating dioxygenase large terminal subunit
MERIFRREWICVGREDEVAESGDYFVTDVGGQPLIIARDEANTLRALSNICSHRGSPLAEGRGNARVFSCPYHAWTYKLDGRLRGAPHMDDSPAFDRERVCLPEFGLEAWQGFLYVNLDPDAQPLAPRLEVLDPLFSQYRVADMKLAFRADTVYACNWKVLCENFCESYHVFRVHPKTLEPYTPTKSVRVLPGGPGYNLHTMDTCETREELEAGISSLAHLGDESLQTTLLSCIYPSHTVAVQGATLIWLSLQPLGPERVRCRSGGAVLTDESDAARLSEAYERMRTNTAAFMAEDEVRIEALQQGLHVFEPSQPFCTMERTNWEFGKYLRARLGNGR